MGWRTPWFNSALWSRLHYASQCLYLGIYYYLPCLPYCLLCFLLPMCLSACCGTWQKPGSAPVCIPTLTTLPLSILLLLPTGMHWRSLPSAAPFSFSSYFLRWLRWVGRCQPGHAFTWWAILLGCSLLSLYTVQLRRVLCVRGGGYLCRQIRAHSLRRGDGGEGR